MKLLLVEDNAADARLIREMLKEAPAGAFQLEHVARLDAARDRLRQEPFDVVLLDLGLPDSQGMETLTLAQTASGGLPIVVLTGRDDEGFALEAVRAGAQDYLVKGRLSGELLVRTIRHAVERKRVTEDLRRLNVELEQRVAERTEALRAVNETLEQRVTERTAEVRKQADQLRALAAELTQAEQRERKRLAKVLHDHIQQLLVAARMQVEWLQRDSRPERLQATAQGVDSILKEALDASRSLTVELSPPVLHEAGLIGGLNWLAARTLERNQFAVVLRAENRAEPPTEDARLMLFECARELLLNAVKHSGVSRAHVTLLRTNDGHIQLIFSDEGKGFDPDLLKKRRPGEASFGLFSIQQRLIHYGGQMEIATAPGKGTRVTMTLPVGEAPPLAKEPSRTARGQAKPEKIVVRQKTAMRRILIVDDHKIMREGLVSLMQFEPDIEVVGQAADGASAIELAARLQPDAIVMDVNLGQGMNGVEVTKRILTANPNIKVIGLSMHTDNDIATALRDAGAVAYLTKGGPSEDLIDAIRTACAG